MSIGAIGDDQAGQLAGQTGLATPLANSSHSKTGQSECKESLSS